MNKTESWRKCLAFLKKDEMPIGAYCSPQQAFVKDGIKYPSMINYKTYKLIADLGINMVFGHDEVFGLNEKDDKDVFKALDLCEKVGIHYLVNFAISFEYLGHGEKSDILKEYPGFPDWKKLSAEEKDDLNNRFIKQLRRVKNKKAFAGIYFIDEAGIESFEGVKEAKKVFEKECPGKLFEIGVFPAQATPLQYRYGFNPKGMKSIDVVDETAWDKVNPNDHSKRYQYYIEKCMDIIEPEYLWWDAYPFLNYNDSESMVFQTLYWHEQFATWVADKYNAQSWPSLQVGGCWENCSAVRITDFADTQLYVNLSLAFGVKGITLFPVCHPNCWATDPIADVGVIDRKGNPTDRYWFYKYAFKQLKACQKYILKAKFKCALVSGEFKGLLPEKMDKDIEPLVYQGELPALYNPVVDSFRELKGLSATNQFFVGCFDYNGKSMFYVVNNSVVTAGNVELSFDETHTFGMIYKGKETEVSGDKIKKARVAAGEGFLLYIK